MFEFQRRSVGELGPVGLVNVERLAWDAGQLQLRRKNNPQKLAISARLRRETTLS